MGQRIRSLLSQIILQFVLHRSTSTRTKSDANPKKNNLVAQGLYSQQAPKKETTDNVSYTYGFSIHFLKLSFPSEDRSTPLRLQKKRRKISRSVACTDSFPVIGPRSAPFAKF